MQVVLIAVISLDGRLTLPGQPGPGFASAEDQAWFHRVLQEFDCAVMGRATYETAREEIRASTRRGYLRVVATRSPAQHATDERPDEIEFTAQAPAGIVADLVRRGRRRCALLGGGQIYREFLDAGVVDALWLTLEPVVLGGGTPLADGGPVRDGRFALRETRLLNPDTLLLNYGRAGRPTVPLPGFVAAAPSAPR
jgi:dihydrofolate reductase